MTPAEALNISFYYADLDETLTIRDYFKALLDRLWEQGEGFSGKRPFGNSGWEYDLQRPLVMAGVIAGTISLYNEDTQMYDDIVIDPERVWTQDELSNVDVEIDDQDAYDAYVFELIAAL